ncbi:hypothetical protein RHSIM_Rhsim08G0210700 [Rhododendron simsii]|uniref:Uncharacterized protein n=1 Tax=Rhododendron simsii TaxID=118357 RepID=A0A834LEM4_RHOSS|nr:hypothetical protein RHSIM_Rhsim08G0210700 [Rhododendron simsii]
MAKSLQLEENRFRHQFGKRAMLQARFNCYSKCQRPDLIMGLKPHAYGSGYTVILQYEVGLLVFKSSTRTNGIQSHKFPMPSSFSWIVFCTPEKGKEIRPEDRLVDGKVRDYADVHWEYFQGGMPPAPITSCV